MAVPGLSAAAAGASSLGTLYVILTADSTNLVAGMNQAVLAINRGSSDITRAAASATAGLTAMSAAAVAAGAAVAAISVNEFAKFEAAMVRSTSIMGDLSKEMKQALGDTARDLARNGLNSATELAGAYLNLASAGYDAEQSQKALGIAQQFSQAGFINMKQSVNFLTDGLSALGLKMKDPQQNMENMQRLGALLVKANILSTASTEELAEALTNKAGPAFRSFSVSAESGIAMLAAFANQGVKGREAGTQAAIALRDLERAALANREEFKRFGIQVFDSNQKLNDIPKIIKQMETAFGAMSDETKRATLTQLGFSDRSLNTILTLLGTSTAMEEYTKQLKNVGDITKEVAEKQTESLIAQWEILKHRGEDILITIGEHGLGPALHLVNELLKVATDRGSDLNKALIPLLDSLSKLLEMSVKLSAITLPVLTKLFQYSPVGVGMSMLGSKLPEELNKAAEAVVKTVQKTSTEVVKANDSVAKSTKAMTDSIIKDWNRAADTVDQKAKQMSNNSFATNTLLDRLGAPDLKDFTGVVRRASPGFALGMSKNSLFLESQTGLGNFGDQGAVVAGQLGKEIEMNKTRLDDLKSIMRDMEKVDADTYKRREQALQIYNERAKQLHLAQNIFVLETSSKMFNDLSTIAEAFGGKQSSMYKAMFAASKAFAIAESVVKIQQGIANAASMPWPLNLAAIASVVAATANIVSTIQSVKLEFSGGKALGGPVGTGKMYMVGEEGPEMFVPNQPGTIIPNNKLGGNVSVNVHNYTDGTADVVERQNGQDRFIDVIIRRTKTAVGSDILEGRGDVNRALQSAFGLRRGAR